MVKILVEPKNALIKQYQKLFDMEEVELAFSETLGGIARRRSPQDRRAWPALDPRGICSTRVRPNVDGWVDEVHVDKDVVAGTKDPVRVYAKKDKAARTSGDAA